MKHLTVDAMIDFVSLTELNREAIELSTVVNGHIRTCRTCRERVSAFQVIFDELHREFTGGLADMSKREKERKKWHGF